MRLLAIILLLITSSLGCATLEASCEASRHLAGKPDGCKAALFGSEALSSKAKKLEALGYDSLVSERISEIDPLIADEILDQGALGRPIDLFRAIAVRPNEYDPQFGKSNFSMAKQGDAYFSKFIDGALIFVVPKKEETFTVIELQVPMYFLTDSSLKDVGTGEFVIDIKKVKNTLLFTKAIGALKTVSQPSSDQFSDVRSFPKF
jgi:hypothetical protein